MRPGDGALESGAVALPASPPSSAAPATRGWDAGARLLVGGLGGLALGLSPLLYGGYAPSTWGIAGLVLVALVLVLVLVGPVRLSRPAALAVAALAALAAATLLSGAWGPSTSLADESSARLFMLALLLLALVLVVRDALAAAVTLGAATAGVLAVAVGTLAVLLAGDGQSVFLGGRLNAPLEYVNGQGSIYVLGLMGCLAATGVRRSALLAGGAAGGATLLAGLAFLCQSRGVTITAIVAAAVVVLCVGGRLRRTGAALLVAGATVAISPPLTDVLSRTTYRGTPAGAIDDAAQALLLAAVGVGLAWGVLVAIARRLDETAVQRLRVVAAAGLAVLAFAAAIGLVVKADAIRERVTGQYHAFVDLEVRPDADGTRLFSGSGTRYDYWRVAVDVFADHPLAGAGAGGYLAPYYRERRTSEDVQQPHSFVLQALAELGLLGGALLAAFVGALGWGAVAAARRAGRDPRERFLVAAGTGMVVAWLVHASVDWILLLPGVTGVAFVGMAAILRPAPGAPGLAWSNRPATIGLAAVGAVLLVLVAVGLGRRVLVDETLTSARSAVSADPAAAIRDADRALALDDDLLPAYYAKAAAQARFGEAAPAIATLHAALEREPDAFVTWALLGDLQTRAGHRAAARRAYARAAALNPRDPTVRAALRRAS